MVRDGVRAFEAFVMSSLLSLGARERRRVIVLHRPGLPVRVVIAPSPAALEDFRSSTHLSGPGVYIGLWDTEVYVGASRVTRSRACRTAWRYRSDPPSARIAIVPTGDEREPSDAMALERIVWAAVEVGVRVQNSRPSGEVVSDRRYRQLHGVWASARWLLRDVAPRLAHPWPEPECVFEGSIPEAPLRLHAESCGARVTVACVSDTQFILEPGTILRRDPLRACGPRIAILRQELRYASLLAPLGPDFEILTRPVELPSLTSVRALVFSQRGTGWGWSPLGSGPSPANRGDRA